MFDLCFTMIQSTNIPESQFKKQNSTPIITFLTSFYLLCTFKPVEEDAARILLPHSGT